MADDRRGQATEEPTAKRLADALRKGEIARSQEIGVAVSLALLAALLSVGGGWLAEALISAMQGGLQRIRPGMLVSSGSEISLAWLLDLARIVGPIALGALLLGLLQQAAQARFRVTFSHLKFDLSRITPKLRRPLKAILVDLLLSFGKLAVVGWLLYTRLQLIGAELTSSSGGLGAQIVWLLGHITAVTWQVVLFAALIAAVDYLWQRRQWWQNLRMTKEEVRREQREMDVKPEVKQKIRQRARELARRKRMLTAVPTASVAITNPTHFAVALRYEPESMDAPVVVAKGTDLFALQIRRAAEEAGVPIVEEPPTARALYELAAVDQAIPPQLYEAVATILAFVWRLNRKE